MVSVLAPVVAPLHAPLSSTLAESSFIRFPALSLREGAFAEMYKLNSVLPLLEQTA